MDLVKKHPPYKYTMDPVELGNYLFMPSDTFDGERTGYVYTNGSLGLGYYLNRPPVPEIEYTLSPHDPKNYKPTFSDPTKFKKWRRLPRAEQAEQLDSGENVFLFDPPPPEKLKVVKTKNDPPPNDILGIYITCHAFRSPDTVENIDGVTITKFNFAGWCGDARSYASKLKTMNGAQKLLYGMDFLPTREQAFNSMLFKTPYDGLDMEGSLSTFYVNPPNGWAIKQYTASETPQECFAVAYKDKTIDLLTCSVDELYDFIGLDQPEEVKKYIVDNILTLTDPRTITTIDLFNLIDLFKLQGITKVNIYDESCNTNDGSKQPEGVGYGGKTKRRKRKRRKSRKK